MNKEQEERYKRLIENNVNVGKTNEGIEFLWLVSGIASICLIAYIFAGNISNFIIDRISTDTQMKIEKAFIMNIAGKIPSKSAKINKLESIKQRIIQNDYALQNKSDFRLYEDSSSEINAFIIPNGTIYVTKGLLDKINDEEMLTFMLAHELGHYRHRDHLKAIGRDVISAMFTAFVSGGEKQLNSTLNGITDIGKLSYSREQEKQADLYANKVLYDLYGRNDGGIKFFEILEAKYKSPDFMQYFSTHPSTKDRIKLLKNHKH